MLKSAAVVHSNQPLLTLVPALVWVWVIGSVLILLPRRDQDLLGPSPCAPWSLTRSTEPLGAAGRSFSCGLFLPGVPHQKLSPVMCSDVSQPQLNLCSSCSPTCHGSGVIGSCSSFHIHSCIHAYSSF